MEICRVIGGFSLGQADNVRKAVGKKNVKLIKEIREEFINKAIAKGYEEKDMSFLYDKIIEPFGGYGFNKSHAACYALLAYQTAFLKSHYSAEFMTVLLNTQADASGQSEKIKRYLKESEVLGLEIVAVDINGSDVLFSTYKNKIIYGLAAVKNVGILVSEAIIEERKVNGNYIHFADFLNRNSVDGKTNKQVVESLIKVGAFDSLGLSIDQLLSVYEEIEERIEREKSLKKGGQVSFFDIIETSDANIKEDYSDLLAKAKKIESNKELYKKYESEILGFNLRYDITRQYISIFRKHTNFDFSNSDKWTKRQKIEIVGVIEGLKIFYTKKDNQEMAVIFLNNGVSILEFICFSKIWKNIKSKFEEKSEEDILKEGSIIKIFGYIDQRQDKEGEENKESYQFIISNIEAFLAFEESKKLEENKDLLIRFKKKFLEEKDFEVIKGILDGFSKGSSKVYLSFVDEEENIKELYQLNEEDFKVAINEEVKLVLSKNKDIEQVIFIERRDFF